MKAVAYIRVSTKEQDEEVQRRAIEEFARKHNIVIVKYYVDKGQSGAKKFIERPGAKELLEEIDKLRPDVLLAWSLDRIGRSMLDTLNTVIMLEKEKGVKVVTIKEEFLQTVDENFRKLIISMLAWFAEFERKRIRERQEEAWRQGKQKGRPPKITREEVEYYLKKYSNLSLRDILRIINSERREKGKPEISYWTLYKKVKELGYTRKFSKS